MHTTAATAATAAVAAALLSAGCGTPGSKSGDAAQPDVRSIPDRNNPNPEATVTGICDYSLSDTSGGQNVFTAEANVKNTGKIGLKVRAATWAVIRLRSAERQKDDQPGLQAGRDDQIPASRLPYPDAALPVLAGAARVQFRVYLQGQDPQHLRRGALKAAQTVGAALTFVGLGGVAGLGVYATSRGPDRHRRHTHRRGP